MDTRTSEQVVNGLIEEGRWIEAFERFAAERIIVRENDGPPIVGKATVLARHIVYETSVARVNEVRLLGSSVNGEFSISEWVHDVTHVDGRRVRVEQTTVRRWSGGCMIVERLYSEPCAS